MKDYLNKLYSDNFVNYCKLLKNDLKKEQKRFIITVNPETIMITYKDKDIKEIMASNYSYVPDGIAIIKAAKKIGINIKERITGIDISTFLLEEANRCSYSIYLFGSKSKIIDDLITLIKNKYPNINIVGYSDGYVKDYDKVMKKIIKLKPDICLVALGIPRQEKIIYKYYNEFKKGIFMGVGGSFDVLSGNKKRAPRIFIKLNLEWLYRIVKEPKRIKRFINNNIMFMLKIRKESVK